MLIRAAVACALVLGLCGCASPSDVEVVYHIEGTARSVSITVETPDGSTQQTKQRLPRDDLSFTFKAGDFVYISAQNDGEKGAVSCRITSGGEVVAENEATGGFAIATCQGEA